MNALSCTISSEVPKLACCVASSICISSKLGNMSEEETIGDTSTMHGAHVNWPSDAAHRSLCEAWTHYIATWRIKYIDDLSTLPH